MELVIGYDWTKRTDQMDIAVAVSSDTIVTSITLKYVFVVNVLCLFVHDFDVSYDD